MCISNHACRGDCTLTANSLNNARRHKHTQLCLGLSSRCNIVLLSSSNVPTNGIAFFDEFLLVSYASYPPNSSRCLLQMRYPSLLDGHGRSSHWLLYVDGPSVYGTRKGSTSTTAHSSHRSRISGGYGSACDTLTGLTSRMWPNTGALFVLDRILWYSMIPRPSRIFT